MEKIILGVLIGLAGISITFSYAYENDYLRAVELNWKFENGFFSDPESDYSKFLESIGGSTMINEVRNGSS